MGGSFALIMIFIYLTLHQIRNENNEHQVGCIMRFLKIISF